MHVLGTPRTTTRAAQSWIHHVEVKSCPGVQIRWCASQQVSKPMDDSGAHTPPLKPLPATRHISVDIQPDKKSHALSLESTNTSGSVVGPGAPSPQPELPTNLPQTSLELSCVKLLLPRSSLQLLSRELVHQAQMTASGKKKRTIRSIPHIQKQRFPCTNRIPTTQAKKLLNMVNQEFWATRMTRLTCQHGSKPLWKQSMSVARAPLSCHCLVHREGSCCST